MAYPSRIGLATGRQQAELTSHDGHVWAVAVTADGDRAVGGGSDGAVRVWDLAGWRAGDPLPPTPPATHCKRGHALSGDNVYEYRGMRHCRACKAVRQREARQRKDTPA